MGRKSAEQLAAEAKAKANTQPNAQANNGANGEEMPQQTSDQNLTQDEKDAKLVFENPQATPYELLQLGLSQSKFEELLTTGANMGGETATNENPNTETDTAEKPTIAEQVSNMQDGGDPAVEKAAEAKANNEAKANEPLKPTLVEKITGVLPHSQAAQPTKVVKATSGGVWVQNAKGGKQLMSQKAAQKLVRMDSRNYKIVSN